MQNKSLNVELRTEKGKNACNRLRNDGFIPAVMYSHGIAEEIKLSLKDFKEIFSGKIIESVLLNLNIDKKNENITHQVFIKDYQVDPISRSILHLDFYKVTEGEMIHTVIPVKIIGTSVGVKMGGILEVVERELEVECLPKDLVENIEVDISDLDIGGTIHIGDITASSSIKFLQEKERIIVTVISPHKIAEEEEVTAEADEEEIEDIGEEDAKDGDSVSKDKSTIEEK